MLSADTRQEPDARMQTTSETRTAVFSVAFFGRPSDRFGRSVDVEAPAEGLTVADLRRRLIEQAGDGAEAALNPAVRAIVDQEIVGDDAAVRPDQEIAFVSALSGG